MGKVEESRIRSAAVRFLELKGFEILDENFDELIVALDSDEEKVLAFVKPCQSTGTCHDKSIGVMYNDDFDALACRYFRKNKDMDCEDLYVRYDVCNLLVIGESRAFIQYRTNALEF